MNNWIQIDAISKLSVIIGFSGSLIGLLAAVYRWIWWNDLSWITIGASTWAAVMTYRYLRQCQIELDAQNI